MYNIYDNGIIFGRFNVADISVGNIGERYLIVNLKNYLFLFFVNSKFGFWSNNLFNLFWFIIIFNIESSDLHYILYNLVIVLSYIYIRYKYMLVENKI